MDKSSLGDRMKGYEKCDKKQLIPRMPVIIRLDGKAFHTLTRKMDKPYDVDFKDIMLEVSQYLVENVMNCKMAYCQSDEISLLLVDYGSFETESWFRNNIQKMVSVSASMATAKFNQLFASFPSDKVRQGADIGMFDARAFNLPKEEVNNYFVWRQQDATRNSIQGLGQATFSHKEMQGLNNKVVQEKLLIEKDINWNDIETYFKRGGAVYRGVTSERILETSKFFVDDSTEFKSIQVPAIGFRRNQLVVDNDIPIFTQDKNFIECHVYADDKFSVMKDYDYEVLKRHARDIASEILERADDIPGAVTLDSIIPPHRQPMKPTSSFVSNTASDILSEED